MRSKQYATYYRVGSIAGIGDVYWSPSQRYAIERDHQYLEAITDEDLVRVEWFDKDGDLDKIVADMGASNGELATAMIGDLYGHILDSFEDAEIGRASCRERV